MTVAPLACRLLCDSRMSLRRLNRCAIAVLAMCAAAACAAAQAGDKSESRQNRLVLYESYGGSANSDGEVMVLTSAVTYHFNSHFSVGGGIPVYFDRNSSSTGASCSSGIGNFFGFVGAVWKGSTLSYGTTLTGAAPTGDKQKGLSTGHGIYDWDNRVEHSIGRFTPFADAGIANAVTDTRFFLRPFTSYGHLAHFEAGFDTDVSHSLTLTLSAYDIAPWGNQTIFSRFVSPGAVGRGGSHGRVFELSQQATGSASLTRDNGFTAGLSASPSRFLDLALGYTRSIHFDLNTISFGVGVNLTRLFSSSRPQGIIFSGR